jgi:hypothetical protein
MRLLPRLPAYEARRLAEEHSLVEWGRLKGAARSSSPRAEYGTTGGVRITELDLKSIQAKLVSAMSDAIESGGPAQFDRAATRILHSQLRISPSEASHPGGWAFLGCVLAPQVVRWRFPGQRGGQTPTERFLGANRGLRNTFGRLWWRAELLVEPDAPDPYELVLSLGEDELVQITERPTLSGDRRVAREIAKALGNFHGSTSPPRMEVMRELAKRLRRRSALLELRAISDDSLRNVVMSELESAVASLAGTSPKVAETKASYNTEPASSASPAYDRRLVFEKVLSPNDIGTTGSHQAAIVVPPRWATQIAPLDETSFNPNVSIEVRSASTGSTWTWRLIHYNGRATGESTRDEYRLTNVGEFLREADPLPGHRIQLWRIGADFEVEIA